MPVYTFTYHAKGSWMPDRRRGYVRRKRGILPPDPKAARAYRDAMGDAEVVFSLAQQKCLVETARGTAVHLNATVHAVFTEPTHVHVVMSWRHDRPWKSMRSSVKYALTRALNKIFGHREWLVDSASRRRVRDQAHFDYLITEYRQKHGGEQWVRDVDLERANARGKPRPA